MKLIGTKKKKLVWSYVLGMVLGCVIIFCGIMANIKEGEPLILVFVGIIVFIICLIYFIDVLKAPNEVIYYDQENKRLLINDKKEIIYLRNIKNIRYKQARSKHGYYKFGHIFIEANDQTYKCKHVENCEDVCYFLHEEIVKAKNEFQ